MATESMELRGLLSINKVLLTFTLQPLPEEITMLHTIHVFPSEHKEFSNELVSGGYLVSLLQKKVKGSESSFASAAATPPL